MPSRCRDPSAAWVPTAAMGCAPSNEKARHAGLGSCAYLCLALVGLSLILCSSTARTQALAARMLRQPPAPPRPAQLLTLAASRLPHGRHLADAKEALARLLTAARGRGRLGGAHLNQSGRFGPAAAQLPKAMPARLSAAPLPGVRPALTVPSREPRPRVSAPASARGVLLSPPARATPLPRPPAIPTAFAECSHTLARLVTAGEAVVSGGAEGRARDTAEGVAAYGDEAGRLSDVYPHGDPLVLAELTGLDEEAQQV